MVLVVAALMGHSLPAFTILILVPAIVFDLNSRVRSQMSRTAILTPSLFGPLHPVPHPGAEGRVDQ